MVRRAVVTGGANNDQNFAVQQVSFFTSVSDCQMLFPYGMYANATSPEEADTLVAMFSVEGVEENKIGIPYAPMKRPRDLEQGEVAFYHPNTNTFIKYRNNGDLEIATGPNAPNSETTGNLIINCNDATINVANDALISAGNNITITATADVNVTCDNATMTISTLATFDVPNATFTGSVKIDGDLEVIGTTTLGSTVTSNSKDISDTHSHVGSPTAPTGVISNTGAPI